ncbi:hypothetical protein [Muriicola sp. Z0-33]|uniref:hypothetical protein n=1 Tax=Muriicola sp. Z0-33 TaxID=2816957 RepID=UPI0022386921|nr:hypothetical protein [Muriicola sp. Z0-33]MCW5517002.1 hypothetical protein [Muriicola sp. Z0-33]
MNTTKSRKPFTYVNSTNYFVGLFLLAIVGFWPSYFSKFFDGTADFTFYMHFHAVLAVLWIFFLIAQPLLIKKKHFALHRSIGKISYILVPLIYISVLLLAHSRITGEEENLGLSLWVPFKDLIIFTFGYGVAIRYRKIMPLHARGMIVAGIVLIEPAMVRAIINLFFDGNFVPPAYLVSIGLLYSLLIILIIAERKEKRGRWIFPVTLGLYIFVHSVILLQYSVPGWQAIAKWFAGLPLT